MSAAVDRRQGHLGPSRVSSSVAVFPERQEEIAAFSGCVPLRAQGSPFFHVGPTIGSLDPSISSAHVFPADKRKGVAVRWRGGLCTEFFQSPWCIWHALYASALEEGKKGMKV